MAPRPAPISSNEPPSTGAGRCFTNCEPKLLKNGSTSSYLDATRSKRSMTSLDMSQDPNRHEQFEHGNFHTMHDANMTTADTCGMEVEVEG